MAEIPRSYRHLCHEIHLRGGRAQMHPLNGLLVFDPETSMDLQAFDLLRMVSLGLLSGAEGELGLTGTGQAVARAYAAGLVTA